MFTANATTTAGLALLGSTATAIAEQAIPLTVGLITATFLFVLIRRLIHRGARKISKL